MSPTEQCQNTEANVHLGAAEALQKKSRHLALPLKLTLSHTHLVLCLSRQHRIQPLTAEQRDTLPIGTLGYYAWHSEVGGWAGSSSLYQTTQTTHQAPVYQLYNMQCGAVVTNVTTGLTSH